MTTALATLQAQVFGDLVGSRPSAPEKRAMMFAPPPQGTVESRWHVYSSGYLARLVEAVENDYPALRRILGEGPFRSLVARYVRQCPPRSYDVGRVGDRLAGFLEADLLMKELPFLPDLARLEWAFAEAFVAADDPPLAWEALTRLPPATVAELPLELHSSVTLVRSRWPIFELRDCQDVPDDAVSIPVQGRPVNALVYRWSLEVTRRAVDDGEAELLSRLGDGGATLTLLADLQGEWSHERLAQTFRLWVSDGLIVSKGVTTQN